MYKVEMLINKMKCLDVEMLQEPNSRETLGMFPSLLFITVQKRQNIFDQSCFESLV